MKPIQTNKILDCTILLVKKLDVKVTETGYNVGSINILSQDDIDAIIPLEELQLIEIFTDNSISIEKNQLIDFIGQKVKLEIN